MKALRNFMGCGPSASGAGAASSPAPKITAPPAYPAPAAVVARPVPAGAVPAHCTPARPAPAAVPAPAENEWETCSNQCGWTAFPGHATCCRRCKGPEGPHSEDCPTKNKRWPPLCTKGCNRPAFGSFSTCCTKCAGPEGPHSKDCANKSGLARATSAGSSAPPRTAEELEQDLRQSIVQWQTEGTIKTRAQVDEIISALSESSGMKREAVRFLWLTVARQARPVGAPVAAYVTLTKKHHNLEVEVIDLGGQSAVHFNSCMFLSCAATLADRRAKGCEDAIPPGFLGDALMEASPDTNAVASIDELIEQHRRHKSGTLGRMADALRHAACEVLTHDSEFFRPYFMPVGMKYGELKEDQLRKAYDKWVLGMRGNEEGDELVILCLSRLLGIAVQPVQQSGYRVPLMDPTGAGEIAENICYWGNDDHHWVWLRPTSEVPSMPPAAASIVVAASGGEAAQPKRWGAKAPGST